MLESRNQVNKNIQDWYKKKIIKILLKDIKKNMNKLKDMFPDKLPNTVKISTKFIYELSIYTAKYIS